MMQGDNKLTLPRESEGEVLRENGREYVMYRDGTGKLVKVFGNWNEAPKVSEREEQGMGQFMAIDKAFDYAIRFDSDAGEYVLDEGATYAEDERPRNNPPVGNLLKQMERMGPQSMTTSDGRTLQYEGTPYGQFSPPVMRALQNYKHGGKVPKVKMADHSITDFSNPLNKAIGKAGNIKKVSGMTEEQKRRIIKSLKTKYGKGGKFPDLNKDGKITMADILQGRGVIPKK